MEMEIKITMRHHFTPARVAIIIEKEKKRNQTPYTLLVGM